MHGFWRVLQSGGTISPGFRWPDPLRTDAPRTYLESEGLRFDDDGRADPAQFVDARELARLAGLEIGDTPSWRTSSTRPLLAQRQAFFETVRELGTSTGALITSWPRGSTQDSVGVAIGLPGCSVALSLATREPAVSCAFYVRDDKNLFAHLHQQREQIEGALGADLEWRDNPEHKASQAILRHDGDWRDAAVAPDLAQWLVSTAETFAPIFAAYVQEYRQHT